MTVIFQGKILEMHKCKDCTVTGNNTSTETSQSTGISFYWYHPTLFHNFGNFINELSVSNVLLETRPAVSSLTNHHNIVNADKCGTILLT